MAPGSRWQRDHASKIAGHASTEITEEHTFVQLKRQEDLTGRIREKRNKAAKRARKAIEIPKKEAVTISQGRFTIRRLLREITELR